MPSSSASVSSIQHNLTTLSLIALLFVALFPSLFHLLLTSSLVPFTYLISSSSLSSNSNSNNNNNLPTPPHNPSTTTTTTMSSGWFQKQFTLPPRSRGSYLVTDHIVSSVPEIRDYKVGLLNVFVQHTSCALSLNENWDDDVRADMSDALDRIAPESGPKGEELYRHSAEGPDDMPAHIKSALVGASVTIPIKDGKLATGTWQGIWYLEFRAYKHTRRVMATIQGEKM